MSTRHRQQASWPFSSALVGLLVKVTVSTSLVFIYPTVSQRLQWFIEVYQCRNIYFCCLFYCVKVIMKYRHRVLGRACTFQLNQSPIIDRNNVQIDYWFDFCYTSRLIIFIFIKYLAFACEFARPLLHYSKFYTTKVTSSRFPYLIRHMEWFRYKYNK